MIDYIISIIGYSIINSPFLILSVLMVSKTEMMSKSSRYKNVEPSDFGLATTKICGVILLLVTIWCILTKENMFMGLFK
ncbi:DUF6199 family natural product biosynthesis protein [Oceanirhabdus seepicola]|uniref:DUF6199 domain-containing protein n=1 Tax=Oceanirhabdus seepicola TaxID=2828781 RepID=A0A9J6P4P5_9CLOT|nr:DUF6199 family natural product biosynthesis protein [Oceanirhabdus seepicola]MCM1990757.1 hypothetical protein [Oceanirhabdus seepicola]